MSSCLDALTRESEVDAGRGGNVNHVQPLAFQHLCGVAVPCGNPVTDGKLFCQQRLTVAHRNQFGAIQMLDHLGVTVGDLAAADDSYTKIPQYGHLFRVPKAELLSEVL